MLYYFNNDISPPNPFQDLRNKLKAAFNRQLIWPDSWPKRRPITKILAFFLMPNHFHLLLKEIKDGGVTSFMEKLGTGMTKHSNTKYQEVGRLFQGPYRAKVVSKENYLKDLSVYIQVKNPFELYPGGLNKAIGEFDTAYDLASESPYNSLADYAGKRNSPIIDKDILGDLFTTPKEYKDFARDGMLARDLDDTLEEFIFKED
jgi:putative transposase